MRLRTQLNWHNLPYVLNDRMYRGGGCTVIERGPKDMVNELHGIPLARSPYFRASYTAFCKATAARFCKAVFVKPVRPRVAHSETIAISFSWV